MRKERPTGVLVPGVAAATLLALAGACGPDEPGFTPADDDATGDDDTGDDDASGDDDVSGDDDTTGGDDDAAHGDPLTHEASLPLVAPEGGPVELVGALRVEGWLYAFGQGGLFVFDGSDPTRPVPVAEHPGGPRVNRLAAGPGDRLVGIGDTGQAQGLLVVFDASDPERPAEARREALDGVPADVATVGDEWWVCVRDRGIERMAPSLDAPLRLDTLQEYAGCTTLAVSGDLVAVGTATPGVALVDASSAAAPVSLGEVPVDGSVQDLSWRGDRLFAALGSAGVAAFDATGEGPPVLLGSADPGWVAFGISAVGDVAFVAGMTHLLALDFAVPGAPVLAAVETAPNIGLGVLAEGDAVWLADWGIFDAYRFHPGLVSPEIEVRPDGALYLAAADAGAESVLEVLNVGHEELRATFPNTEPGLSFSPAEVVVLPGQGVEVDVSFVGEGPLLAEVEVATNDPDEPVLRQSVQFDPEGFGPGSAAPDFTLPLLEGGTVTLSQVASTHAGVLLYFFTTW